eukprot:86838-Rhodomonas_salina.3
MQLPQTDVSMAATAPSPQAPRTSSSSIPLSTLNPTPPPSFDAQLELPSLALSRPSTLLFISLSTLNPTSVP